MPLPLPFGLCGGVQAEPGAGGDCMKLFTSDCCLQEGGGLGGGVGNKPSLRRIGEQIICTSLQQGWLSAPCGCAGSSAGSVGLWRGEQRG